MKTVDTHTKTISYSRNTSSYGTLTIGSIGDAICFIGFDYDGLRAEEDLQLRFSDIALQFTESHTNELHLTIRELIDNGSSELSLIETHLIGTPFQKQVWEALCDIPFGATASYSDIAAQIGSPKAVRAVGSAIGANPISIIIPCHRVLRSNGDLGGYRWGLERKKALLASEVRS